MILLNQVFRFFKLVHSESSARQLSLGFLFGFYMGLTPPFTLLQFVYVILLLIVRVNFGAVFLSFALFKAASFGVDPIFNTIGTRVLRAEALEGLWTFLYNSPVVPYTFFYNSIIMGAVTVSVALTVPLYFLSAFLIDTYRATVVRRFKGTWLFRAWLSSKLYPLYVKYTQFKDS
ncbi:MAG: TIGR03546 family protein [Deltaproteobacteria bacterium]|nr:TIGR03546 family protein [Deltaproteobacteria bacterium]MBI3294407.1 TIGR03546 family protein [Deltaproteobacteria bacterium]